MDRNVFVAIALSMSVLLFWGAFFETPKKTSEQQTNKKVEQAKKIGIKVISQKDWNKLLN